MGAAGVLLLAAGLPAAAHVTVSSPDAVAGGFGKLVIRVPTESDTASTRKVQVTLPADTPFASVSTSSSAPSADDSDPVARVLAGIGVLLAAGALVLALVGERRRSA